MNLHLNKSTFIQVWAFFFLDSRQDFWCAHVTGFSCTFHTDQSTLYSAPLSYSF